MKYSKLVVEILSKESGPVYYDPVYHGRTLKIIGIDDDPTKVMADIVSKYREKGYDAIVFDTTGNFPEEGFDNVVKVEDGKEMGLDPIKLALAGIIGDPYSAATIVQTLYSLDRALTDRLYADILAKRVSSVPEAAKKGEKYSEVIMESYTELDERLYSGEAPKLEGSVLVDFGNAHSITVAQAAFLTLAAAFTKRRNVVIGIDDAAVLTYSEAGSAALPLLTRPMRRRATILATRYAMDALLQTAGPTLLLYTDPDTQAVVYEANGVPPGAMRKHVHKGQGAFIYRTPETINVEWGELPGD
nr:hypothetical protein [Palaeococcus ferrophilus]